MSLCFLSLGLLEAHLRTIEDPSLKREALSHLRSGYPGKVLMLAAGGRKLRGSVERLSGKTINDCNNICCLVSIHHQAGLPLPVKDLWG